jgi:hypothetical protein
LVILHINQALHCDHRDVIGLVGVFDMNQQFNFCLMPVVPIIKGGSCPPLI